MNKLLLSAFLFTWVALAQSPNNLAPHITATKLNCPVIIDGILNEPIWQNKPSVDAFIQKEPTEGALPSERTEAYIAFDDEALYIAARMYDAHPDSIIARLTRRDNVVTADRLLIYLDPYHDQRSGFYFTINAAGILTDGILYNDDWNDNSWDAVWEGKACIDEKGWTVEVRIPFSQLRFKNTESQVWGINLKRIIARRNEEDNLIRVPKNENGFVSRFINLYGLDGIKPVSKIEILPYVTGKAEYLRHTPGDPFNDGSQYTPDIGADLKMGIGNNLTLNATVNPDFGQVEIDPAVLNLSDVETYYSEKRPFFTEGSSVFNFGNGGAGNFWSFNWGSPNLFYSRRIGRTPHGSAPGNADFANVPSGTHILGAAKLTGKVWDDWNLGVIQGLTRREYADYQVNGVKAQAEVEPLAYYSVARLQREMNSSRQGIGILATYTGRNFKDESLADITNKSALTFGIDGWTSLDTSKTWVFTGYSEFSHVQGTKQQIISLQENSQHYFQRPDMSYIHVDSNRTALTGYAGRFYLIKQKGDLFINSAFGFISPEFDCNDLGFLSYANVINMHVGGGYDWTTPTSYYHFLELGLFYFRNLDYDWNKTAEGIFTYGNYQLPNYYFISWNYCYNPATINNRRTRGGPLSINPAGWQVNLSANSDDRKSLVGNVSFFSYQAANENNIEYDLGFEYRPASNIDVSISPFYNRELTNAMYVGTQGDKTATATYGSRYVFGTMDQKTIGAGIRLNWTFTPMLNLQLYVQPLLSTGTYSGIKELARPRSFMFNQYQNIQYNKDDNTYTIDPDGAGPAGAFTINNPDFNFKSLRGNAVLRWEYMPGSVFYFVWTQSRSDVESTGDFSLRKSFSGLTDIHPDNIFAMKFTYWFNM